jgi:hypothetical protein
MNNDQLAALNRILDIAPYICEDNAHTNSEDAAIMKDVSLLRAWAASAWREVKGGPIVAHLLQCAL